MGRIMFADTDRALNDAAYKATDTAVYRVTTQAGRQETYQAASSAVERRTYSLTHQACFRAVEFARQMLNQMLRLLKDRAL